MTNFRIDEGTEFSLLRVGDFAKRHRHAFIVRGRRGAVLFRPGPVPRDEICGAAGLEGARLHLARQVHGAGVAEFSSTEEPPGLLEADALVTRTIGHAVGVATADCLPVLLASSAGACAAVHAGWKGLLAGVIEAGLKRLMEIGPAAEGSSVREASTVPLTVEAAIGPAIGACCFEVGPEVAERFLARFPQADGHLRPSGTPEKSLVDLRSAAVAILASEAIPKENIHHVDLCTRCRPDLLESYRRDGDRSGRVISLIGPAM